MVGLPQDQRQMLLALLNRAPPQVCAVEFD
jgi:hypothetical protein